MARAAKKAKSASGARRGRPPAAKKAPVRKAAATTRSNDTAELRATVEKLTRTHASMRKRVQEVAAMLEGRLEELELRMEAMERRSGHSHDIDPGDSVPEGVAVEEPEPLDEEAEDARDNLVERLSDDQEANSD